MLGRKLIPLIFAAGLFVSSAPAEVVVKLAPPKVVVEKRGPAPGAGYVWIAGYQNWDGNRYVWVPGRWEKPPHEGARWEPHKWVKRKDGWALQEGRWR